MLSSDQIETIREELTNLYRDIEVDTLSATSRDRTIRGNQNMSAVQRVLDMLPSNQ